MKSGAGTSRPPWAVAAQGRLALPDPADPAHRRQHLTPRQTARLNTHLQAGDPDQVEPAWSVYQRVRKIYDHSVPAARGRERAEKLLASLHTCPVPELARLGRTLRS